MALEAEVLRDGEWKTVQAKTLVPGDVVRIRRGDIVSADMRILQCLGEAKVDQSGLTGESLPVDKIVGDDLFSGSTVKQGELVGIVSATGDRTFFGKAAGLMQETGTVGTIRGAVAIMRGGDRHRYVSRHLLAVDRDISNKCCAPSAFSASRSLSSFW